MLHSELPFDLRVREQEQHSRHRSLLTETSERKRNGEKALGQRPTRLLDASSLHRRAEALACLLISQLEKFHSESDLLARQKPASRQRAVQTAECVSPFLPHTGARSPSDNKICISRLQNLHPHEDFSIYRPGLRGSLEACHAFRLARCSIHLHAPPASC